MDVFLTAAEHHDPGFMPYIVAGIAAAFFIVLGVITHSYRDVANRAHRVHADPNAHRGH